LRWLIVVGVFVGGLVWLWRSTWEGPIAAERSERDGVARTTAPPRRTAIVPQAPRARLALPQREGTFDATSHHTADPCTAFGEPIVPATFESITAAGITVAWDPTEAVGPYDAGLRPTSLAFAVAGILEEAAQLTGTDRRQTLTVIVDGSTDAFQARTKAPSWTSGLYDGGAIHLGAKQAADLGVAMQTLRHEVMHAQMHATIGCTPFWFNEGLATYFAGTPPPRELVLMLRGGEPFDLQALREPAIFDVKAENAARMYAVSLAMVLYLVQRSGELGIREAVQIARSLDTIPAALDLWTHVAPNIDHPAVLDALAQRVFGQPRGPTLDALLRGSVCCVGLRSPGNLQCRAPGSEPPRREICRRY
jgi:hypothetical protein